jgi:hypothetical protein
MSFKDVASRRPMPDTFSRTNIPCDVTSADTCEEHRENRSEYNEQWTPESLPTRVRIVTAEQKLQCISKGIADVCSNKRPLMNAYCAADSFWTLASSRWMRRERYCSSLWSGMTFRPSASKSLARAILPWLSAALTTRPA